METLGIFAKYWQPGSVKTRLADSIGPEAAAHLQRQFLVTLLGRFGHASDERALVFDPPERREDFAALISPRWQLAPQSEGGLGARMRAFVESALAAGSQRVVLIGADSPTLPVAYVRQAFELLRNNPVVLGPAGDGGYYLVGLADRIPAMFENIDWGTSAVWEQTQQALRREGVAWVETPAWYDVDELADLERLRAELKKLSAESPILHALEKEVSSALAVPTRD